MRLFAFLANRSTPTSCLHCYSEQSVRLAWQKHQITSLSPKGRKEPATLNLFIGPNIRWTQHGYCDCLIASCCWMINHSTWTAINNFNLIPWIRQDKICVLIKCFQPSTRHSRLLLQLKGAFEWIFAVGNQFFGLFRRNVSNVNSSSLSAVRSFFSFSHVLVRVFEAVRKTVSLVRNLFPQRHIKKASETLPGHRL